MRRRRILASSASIMTLMQLSTPVAAQERQAELESETDGVPVIIVTARKVEETLQETPISITAFTGDEMSRSGINDISDIAVRTPGLAFGDFGDQKLSPTSLRGVIGSGGSAGADPAVGFYLDEVYLGQGAGASIDLFDLERVEVLRGPQGTLFGRNTIGGVISYTTAQPTRDFEAHLEGDTGNYDYWRLGAVVSGPLIGDAVAGRLSFVTNQRGGTERNLVLDKHVNSDRSWMARGQLLFSLSDATEWRISADYREVDQDSLVFETLKYDLDSDFVALLGLFGYPLNEKPFDRKVYADIKTRETLEAWGATSTFSTRLGSIDIVNVTGFREHDYYNITDTDRSALRLLYDGDPESISRFSSELRFSSKVGPVKWVAGAYYFDQNSTNRSFVRIGQDLAEVLGAPEAAGLESGSDADMQTESTALFGSATWALTSRLDVTAGGRYTWERKSIDYLQSDALGILGGDFAIVAKDKWSKFTPSANLRYRFTPETMVYFTVSQGFKSGGFNDALGDATGIGFGPESLWNYEVGLKSGFFNGRVQTSFSVFYMDWSDIQISTDNPDTPVLDPITLNAGSAHSQGVEFEIAAVPMRGLTLRFNGTLLEAKYDEGTLPDGTPLDRIPYSPDFTANFSGEYRSRLSGTVNWFLGGEYLLRGKSFLTPDNDPDSRVATYGLLNLRAGIEAEDGRWRLGLWGKNITDETVKNRIFDLTGLGIVGQKFVALNEPATYGLSFHVRY